MIREYQDPRIQKNLNLVRGLSIAALVFGGICIFIYLFRKWYPYEWMIANPNDISYSYLDMFWGGTELWRKILRKDEQVSLGDEIFSDFSYCLFYLSAALITYSMTSKRDKGLSKIRLSETKRNNDFSNTLTAVIIDLLHVALYLLTLLISLILVFAGHYEIIAEDLRIFSSHLGYMLLSYIFIIISSGYLICNCIYIKREWRENPPPFLAEKMKKAAEEARFIKIAEDTATCQALLEECGMQFFVEYYTQIKRLPLRDVIVSDHYFPEREVRLTAAKKIIDLGLSEYALRYIIRKYGDVFSSDVIDRAKSILNEIKSEKGETR